MEVRATALIVMVACGVPAAALGQGSQAAGLRAGVPGWVGPPRVVNPSVLRPAGMQFVMERPATPAPGPLGHTAAGGRAGLVAGWMVGLVIGPAILEGRDMGCDDIECFGALSTAEASLAGAVVAGGVGYLVGNVLALVTDLDDQLLDVLRIKISPRGKPGLKVKTSIRF